MRQGWREGEREKAFVEHEKTIEDKGFLSGICLKDFFCCWFWFGL